jgi:hypothetical protein
VATEGGSRGFAELGIESLISTPDVPSMAGPLADLLQVQSRRHRLESSGRERIHHLDWQSLGVKLSQLLRETLA